MLEHEAVDRLARLETKMDMVIVAVTDIRKNQDSCPAKSDYIANHHVLAKRDLQRSRLYGLTGWVIAILAGLLNFGEKIVSWAKP